MFVTYFDFFIKLISMHMQDFSYLVIYKKAYLQKQIIKLCLESVKNDQILLSKAKKVTIKMFLYTNLCLI